MPVTIICEHCGVSKAMPPSVFNRTAARFCSKKCEGAARSLRIEIACAYCGAPRRVRRDHVKPRNFCSHKCATTYRAAQPSRWGRTPDVEVRRTYFHEYTKRNRERINVLSATWSRRNRAQRNRLQQMRRAGGCISAEEWQSILDAAGGACVRCGAADRVEMDHIVPVALGGTTERDNLQPLCRSCNASKGAKLMKALHGEVREV